MDKKENSQRRKITPKQAGAIIGILLLVLVYVVTFIMSIADNSASARWFYICLFATFAVPLLLWIYIWMYGKLTGKPTIADPDMGKTESNIKASSGTAPSVSKPQDIPSNDTKP